MVICSWYSGGRIGVLQTWSSCNALMCAVYHQEKGRVHWVTPAALLSIIFLVLCLILCCHYFVSLFCLPYSIKRWHWMSFWSRSEPCSGSGIITIVWISSPRKSRRPCGLFATDIHSLQELARSKYRELVPFCFLSNESLYILLGQCIFPVLKHLLLQALHPLRRWIIWLDGGNKCC